MNEIVQKSVELVTITVENEQQRIDNFLLSKLKGVPKSLIYRILRPLAKLPHSQVLSQQ